MMEPLTITNEDAKRIISTHLENTSHLKSYTGTVNRYKTENFLTVRCVKPEYKKLSNPLYPVIQLCNFGLKSSATGLGLAEIAMLNHLCDAFVDISFYMENDKYCLIFRTRYFPHTPAEIHRNKAMSVVINEGHAPMEEFAFYYDPEFLKPETLAKTFELKSEYPAIYSDKEGKLSGYYQSAILRSTAAYSYLMRRMEDDLFISGGTQHDISRILEKMEHEKQHIRTPIIMANRVFRPRELNGWIFQHMTKTFKAELEADLAQTNRISRYRRKYPELFNTLERSAALRI